MDDGGDLTGCRVLVVEDEFLLAMELEILLSQRGCTVLGPVPTVRQALAMLGREQPEAALLDVNLKGERATPIAVALRERSVPFVLVTGYSEHQLSEPELHEAPRLGKPVNGRELKCALVKVLDSKSSS